VIEAGEDERIRVDSAGTGSWHIGSGPHPQTQEILVANNIDPLSERGARQVVVEDFITFTHIVAMDSSNLEDLRALRLHAPDLADKSSGVAELSLLLEHADPEVVSGVLGEPGLDVPDPYYVGGYDRVYELVRSGCEGLFESLV
jgi:protein-tyrosine phosphatase